MVAVKRVLRGKKGIPGVSLRGYARNSYHEKPRNEGEGKQARRFSSASPCMHRYGAAHVCTVCYAHARNALRTRVTVNLQSFSSCRDRVQCGLPWFFENPARQCVVSSFLSFFFSSPFFYTPPPSIREQITHPSIMLAYIVGFFYFYAELLRLELQMLLHPEEFKLSKFML